MHTKQWLLRVFLFVSWPARIKTPADTTTAISSVCSRCGTIGKSGKSSCCGRGGSWFKNCGGSGNKKLHHTWYEGIQACKARSQSKAVVGQQLNGAQQKDIDSSEYDDMTKYKAVIAANKTFRFTSVNALTPMSDTPLIVTSTYTSGNVPITESTHTSASTSTITKGCTNLLKVTLHINLLFMIIS